MIWLWLLAVLRLLLLDADPPEGDDNGDDDGDEGEQPEEEIRDPKAKLASLKEANARLAKKAKKLEARVAELERGTSNGGQALRSAQLEAAYLRAVMNSDPRITDVETAWDLADAKGFLDPVKINDEGEAEGMDAAIEKLVARYPWLIEDSEEEPPPPSTPKPATRPVRRDKERKGLDSAALEKRFGALRRRGRH